MNKKMLLGLLLVSLSFVGQSDAAGHDMLGGDPATYTPEWLPQPNKKDKKAKSADKKAKKIVHRRNARRKQLKNNNVRTRGHVKSGKQAPAPVAPARVEPAPAALTLAQQAALAQDAYAEALAIYMSLEGTRRFEEQVAALEQMRNAVNQFYLSADGTEYIDGNPVENEEVFYNERQDLLETIEQEIQNLYMDIL